MSTTVLGIDLGKRWFHVVGRDPAGHISLRQKFNRAQLVQFIAQHRASVIGMETCCGSQYFARKFLALGHTVKLLPAQFVKPFVKSQKNDFNDALAISEAVVLPTMRFVPVRTEEQWTCRRCTGHATGCCNNAWRSPTRSAASCSTVASRSLRASMRCARCCPGCLPKRQPSSRR